VPFIVFTAIKGDISPKMLRIFQYRIEDTCASQKKNPSQPKSHSELIDGVRRSVDSLMYLQLEFLLSILSRFGQDLVVSKDSHGIVPSPNIPAWFSHYQKTTLNEFRIMTELSLVQDDDLMPWERWANVSVWCLFRRFQWHSDDLRGFHQAQMYFLVHCFQKYFTRN